jgi:hypothetical protein
VIGADGRFARVFYTDSFSRLHDGVQLYKLKIMPHHLESRRCCWMKIGGIPQVIEVSL